MLVFGSLLVLSSISLLFKNKKNLISYFLYFGLCFLLIFFAAFRNSSVGSDTKQFVLVFEGISQNDWSYFKTISGFNGRIEPGFYLLCKLLSYLSNDYVILLLVTSLFSLAVIFYFIKTNSSDIFLSILLFIGLQFYAYYLTAMRQILALSIIILGMQLFLKKNRNILFIVSVIIAYFFHRSAIVGILFLFFYKFTLNKFWVGLFLVVSMLAFVLGDRTTNFLASIFGYEQYISSDYDVSNYNAAIIKTVLYGLFILIIIYTFLHKNDAYFFKNNRICNFASFMLLFSFCLQVLAINSIILERVIPYFSIIGIILIPNFIDNINDKERIMIKFSIALICIFYCIIVLNYRPEWTKVVPYLFRWENTKI